jgi:hypothetical protein
MFTLNARSVSALSVEVLQRFADIPENFCFGDA